MIVASVNAGTVISALAIGFVTGALARLAVPGPDPMPAWLTILIGLVGVFGGGGIAYGAGSRDPYVINLAGFFTAVLLVLGYRRFVQRRPIWGRDAYQFPKRGFGVENYRNRLQRAGIDPDKLSTAAPATPLARTAVPKQTDAGDPTDNPAHYLGLLEELHDNGVLSDDEYEAARLRLLERLRS